MYMHKDLLADKKITNREKIVFAYLLTFKKSIRITNKEIALAVGTTEREIKKVITVLVEKKYITTIGSTRKRELKVIRRLQLKFEKGTFNGFQIDEDILRLKMDATKKLLLAEVQSFLSSVKGECKVSNAHLAEHLNVKESAVQYALAFLEKAGFIKREFKQRDGKVERKLHLPCADVSVPEVLEQGKHKEKTEENAVYGNKVIEIFNMFPLRPMMTKQKVQEQRKLCLPILKKKTREELDFIKFAINMYKKNESWLTGFMPYMYTFLSNPKKYFTNEIKNAYHEMKSKPKVNVSLQEMSLMLNSDLFYFVGNLSAEDWEESDEIIFAEFAKINGLRYKKYNPLDFKKLALRMIKEYRPSNLDFSL